MDIQLHYTEHGRGNPLILLHGNGESSDYFIHQIDYFTKMFRVIAVDTRGHGKSPRGEKPFTLRQFAEDLREFMDEHQIEKAKSKYKRGESICTDPYCNRIQDGFFICRKKYPGENKRRDTGPDG